jgi:HK97 family phage portal protein
MPWNPLRTSESNPLGAMRGVWAAEIRDGGTVQNPTAELLYSFAGGRLLSGVHVNPDTAGRVSVAYACGNVISQDIGKLPFKLYRGPEDNKKLAKDHPAYVLAARQPNRWQTAYEWRRDLMWSLLFRGNAFTWARRDGRANLLELVPIHAGRVRLRVEPSDGALFYDIAPRSYTQQIPPVLAQRDMNHLRSLAANGPWGRSAIQEAPEVLALTMAALDHNAAVLGNQGMPPFLVKTPTSLTPEQERDWEANWTAKFGGPRRAGRFGFTSTAVTIDKIGLSPQDLQLLELAEFQIPEVARLFRLQLHKIQELKRATFSNIEQQAREYIDDTLYPWFVCIEQAAARDFLLPEERDEFFFKFNADALLRGDTLSRYRANILACGGPWLTRDEVRMQEDRNAFGGPMAQILTPTNNMSVGDGATPAAEEMDQRVQDLEDRERNREAALILTSGNGAH